MTYLKRTMICDKNKQGFQVCLCSESDMESFPNIMFQIGDGKYTMTRDTYVERVDEVCNLKLRSYDFETDAPEWGQGYWVLGAAFLTNY